MSTTVNQGSRIDPDGSQSRGPTASRRQASRRASSRRSSSRRASSRRSSSRRSKTRSARSSKVSQRSIRRRKARKEAALQVKAEREYLVDARTRQAGLQAMRAIVLSLQAFSVLVVVAAFVYAALTYLNSDIAILFTGALAIEVTLLLLGMSLIYFYSSGLRWIYWLAYLAVLVFDGYQFWEHETQFNEGKINWHCDKNSSEGLKFFCPTYLALPNCMQPVVLRYFLIVMHLLVLILSFFWRACYEGSMDQLKQSKLGCHLIAKHSQRSSSVRPKRSKSRSHHSHSSRRRTGLPPGTVSTLKRQNDLYGCQFVKEDGTKQHAVLSTSTSEIFTHSAKGCKKSVVKDMNVQFERNDGSVVSSRIPTQISHKDIACNHEDVVIKGQAYPNLKSHGPQNSRKQTGTQSEGACSANADQYSTKSATDSYPAGRFNSITMMPALESPIALLNKMEKQREQNKKSQYHFKE